jgi:phosphatidylglycerophosphate synthase
MKVTIKEIKQKYLEKKSYEKKYLWTYHVRRPLSYYIAWCLLRLGITANNVTLSYLLVGIMGCILLSTGNHLYFVVGALLVEFSNILDSVDGHIARFTGPSYVGYILDDWSGEIVHVSSMFSLGIGLSKMSPVSMYISILPVIREDAFLYVGFLAALSALFAWSVRNEWLSIAPRSSSSDDMEPDSALRNSKKVKLIDNLFSYSGAYAPLMVISAIFGILEIFLALVFMVYGLFLLILMGLVMRRAHLLDMGKTS